MEGKIDAIFKNNEAEPSRTPWCSEGNYNGVSASLPQVHKSILVCVWVGMSLVLKTIIVPFLNYYKSQLDPGKTSVQRI